MKKTLLLPFLTVLLLLQACNNANPVTEKQEEEHKETPREDDKKNAKENPAPKIGMGVAKKVMEDYSMALSSKDMAKLEALFAPKVTQWITMKNTDPKAIGKAASQFLSKKPEAVYKANLDKIEISGNRIVTEMLVSWKSYEAEVLVEMELDEQEKISYYREKEILSQSRESTVAGGGGTKAEAFNRLLVLKAPYDMGSGEKDKRFYLGSMSGSDEMEPFHDDVNELPSQLYGKLKIHDNVWLVFVDFSYRFYSEYRLFTYDNQGNKLEEGPGGTDVKFPVINGKLVISTHDGDWTINKKGGFEKR